MKSKREMEEEAKELFRRLMNSYKWISIEEFKKELKRKNL